MPVVQRQQAKPTPKPSNRFATGVSAWDLIDTLRVLVYGTSGTGKTRFWSTFPGTVLALICSGGAKPGELRSIDTLENRKRITPVTINSMDEFRKQLARADQFENVVLDHISGFQDLVLKEILGIDEIPAQKGWGLATQQQYGQCTLQCKECLRALLNLPGNVVIVGQERTFGGKEDGGDPDIIKPAVGVAVTPSLCGWLNPACDFVLQTFIRPVMVTSKTKIGSQEIETTKRGDGVQFCARIGKHDVFMTKFRVTHDNLPDVVVNPTHAKIVSIIKGTYKE